MSDGGTFLWQIALGQSQMDGHWPLRNVRLWSDGLAGVSPPIQCLLHVVWSLNHSGICMLSPSRGIGIVSSDLFRNLLDGCTLQLSA